MRNHVITQKNTVLPPVRVKVTQKNTVLPMARVKVTQKNTVLKPQSIERARVTETFLTNPCNK